MRIIIRYLIILYQGFFPPLTIMIAQLEFCILDHRQHNTSMPVPISDFHENLER